MSTCLKLHQPECTFGRIFSRKLIFQKLYTLAQNFVIDRTNITKIYNDACTFLKITRLRAVADLENFGGGGF